MQRRWDLPFKALRAPRVRTSRQSVLAGPEQVEEGQKITYAQDRCASRHFGLLGEKTLNGLRCSGQGISGFEIIGSRFNSSLDCFFPALSGTALATLGSGGPGGRTSFANNEFAACQHARLLCGRPPPVDRFSALLDDADLALGLGLVRSGLSRSALSHQYRYRSHLQVQVYQGTFPGHSRRVSKGSSMVETGRTEQRLREELAGTRAHLRDRLFYGYQRESGKILSKTEPHEVAHTRSKIQGEPLIEVAFLAIRSRFRVFGPAWL